MPPVPAVLVFILWGGAELGDLVRGALQSIPKVQYESSYVLGLSPWSDLLPGDSAAGCSPYAAGIRNLATRIVKTTSLAVLLGVVEVIKVASRLSTRTDSSSRLEPCGFMA